MKKRVLSRIIIIILVVARAHQNFISNGDFQSPAICPSCSNEFTDFDSWRGFVDFCGKFYYYSLWNNKSQYVDLRVYDWGWIMQSMMLPQNKTYNLTFKIIASDANASVDVYWNNNKLKRVMPASNTVETHTIFITGYFGLNNLAFVDIRSAAGSSGLLGVLLDDVSLEFAPQWAIPISTQYPIPNSITNSNSNSQAEPSPFIDLKELLSLLKKIAKLPLNQIKLSSLNILLQDFWLYNYSNRTYFGLFHTILKTAKQISALKWEILHYSWFFDFQNMQVSQSNYSLFSNKKHIEVDGHDDVLINNLYLFFLCTIPQTIVLCLILRKIFTKIQESECSVALRRYCFLTASVLQILLEGNLAYFAYLSFNQLKISFFFTFSGKLFYLVCIFLLWASLVFAIAYFYVINGLLNNKAGYFIHDYYRTLMGLTFLTFRMGFRSFFKGAIFSLLYGFYLYQIMALILVEVLVSLLTLFVQSLFQIFILKGKICIIVTYHSLFMFLNILLYFEEVYRNSDIASILVQAESIVITLILALVSVEIVYDLFVFKKSKKSSELSKTNLQTNSKSSAMNETNKKLTKF